MREGLLSIIVVIILSLLSYYSEHPSDNICSAITAGLALVKSIQRGPLPRR